MAQNLMKAKKILAVGSSLYLKGMLVGSEGNISTRLDEEHILITPSGLNKGSLKSEDLVVVDKNGKQVKGNHKPSSEIAMHLFIYQNRPEINACVHSHAPYATAFAVAGRELPDNLLPEIVLFIGRIPLTAYASPGTKVVADTLKPYISDNNAFLLRNHGLVTVGKTLQEAYDRHEIVEHYAQIVYLAQQLGNATPLPQDNFKHLTAMRQQKNKSLKSNP
ncbi:MAG: class II aldolase/adducin family protein [FCB group bacterium]|nr:class II aldolase/adducin family protein [FCB group bacterium]